MVKSVKKGDHVAWDTSQGETTGTVERKLTRATKIKGHVAKPDAAHPQYLVKSDKTGAVAAHKPSELRKKKKKS